jgi:hypothetical protein
MAVHEQYHTAFFFKGEIMNPLTRLLYRRGREGSSLALPTFIVIGTISR